MRLKFIGAVALLCFLGSQAQAQAVRSSLEAFPIAAPAINLPVAPAQRAVNAGDPVPAAEWRIEVADGTLSRALRRWARDARTPLLWEAPKDLPAVAASYRSDFLGALEQVMQDSQDSSYPLHACAYTNVVRVLHVSQSCNR